MKEGRDGRVPMEERHRRKEDNEGRKEDNEGRKIKETN
jgi:hypothetical protein